MTEKEKAKAYDEALKIASFYYGNKPLDAEKLLEKLFPTLAESKDERMIKAIVDALLSHCNSINLLSARGYQIEDVKAWLEKQKELPTNEEMLRTLRAEYEKGVADTIAKYEQEEPAEELSTRLNGLMQEYVKAGKDEEEQEYRLKCYQLFWDALGDSEFFEQKEQKVDIDKLRRDLYQSGYNDGYQHGREDVQKEQEPILEVFGFKVGDAVRLKDGDGRKHIIKSFEEVKGIHGPNFYLVEFEDNSARDGIYPGEKYPNGYYTQMEKFEEERKPVEPSDDELQRHQDELYDFKVFAAKQAKEHHISFVHDFEWNNFCAELLSYFNGKQKPVWSDIDKGILKDAITAADLLGNDESYKKEKPNLAKAFRIAKNWLEHLPERLSLQPKQEWSEDYNEENIQTRFAFYTYKDDTSTLYLSNVFVEEASRNHGFGTKILKAAEKVADTLGATTISLKVKRDSPANDWYRKNGYGYVTFEGEYDWREKNLKYLKPKKEVEWSKEDEEIFNLTITHLLSYAYPNNPIYRKEAEKCAAWLKSLRPQSKDEIYKEKNEAFKLGKQQLAIAFIKYLDKNRPEGKMCLSNGECKDIDDAFQSGDWTKIMRYVEKYCPSWKPSEEQMNAFRSYIKDFQEKAEAAVGGWDNFDVMIQLFEQLQKLK